MILFGHLLARLAPAEVTLVTSAEKGALLVGVGAVKRSLDFDSLPMHEVFSDEPLDHCRLAELLGGHDRLISCFAAGDGKAQIRLAAMCGCDTAAFLPIRPPAGADGHLLDLWLDLLGMHEHGTQPMNLPSISQWTVPGEWRKAGETLLTRAGISSRRTYWTIHPGSGGKAKCWSLSSFIELASRPDVAPAGARPVFLLGPAEAERMPRGQIGELASRFGVISCPPLAALAGLLAGAAGYVGNDSGVSHLAAAVGAPTVAIFGASEAGHFAPLGPRVAVVAGPSMAAIAVDTVAECCKSLFFGK